MQEVIIMLGVAQAIFLILLIASKKRKSRPLIYLVLWLAVMALHLVFYLVNFNGYHPRWEVFHILGFSLSLVHAPLFFLCSRDD